METTYPEPRHPHPDWSSVTAVPPEVLMLRQPTHSMQQQTPNLQQQTTNMQAPPPPGNQSTAALQQPTTRKRTSQPRPRRREQSVEVPEGGRRKSRRSSRVHAPLHNLPNDQGMSMPEAGEGTEMGVGVEMNVYGDDGGVKAMNAPLGEANGDDDVDMDVYLGESPLGEAGQAGGDMDMSVYMRGGEQRRMEVQHEQLRAQQMQFLQQNGQHAQPNAVPAGYGVAQYPQGGQMFMLPDGRVVMEMRMQAPTQQPGMQFYGSTPGAIEHARAQQAQAAMQNQGLAMQGFSPYAQNPMLGYGYPAQQRRVGQEQQQLQLQVPQASAYGSPQMQPSSYPLLPGHGGVPTRVYQQHMREQQSAPASPAQAQAQAQAQALTRRATPPTTQRPHGYPAIHGNATEMTVHGRNTQHPEVQEHDQAPAETPNQDLQQVLDGHRHSHPGALLAYGPPPAPVQQPMPGNISGMQLSARSAGPGQFTPDQLMQAGPQSGFPVPTLAMYNFVHAFINHYRNCPPARLAFEKLCLQFNRHLIGPTHFYVSIYRILYRTNSLKLLDDFEEFIPQEWKGRDRQGFHASIEREADEMFGAHKIDVNGGGVLKRQPEEDVQDERVAKVAKRAAAMAMQPGRTARKTSAAPQPMRESLIVVLPVRFEEEPAVSHMPKQTRRQTLRPMSNKAESELVGAKKALPRKKKAPVNGFKTGGQLRRTRGQAADKGDEQSRDSSPLTSLESSTPNSPKHLQMATPALTSPPPTKPKHQCGHLPASQVPHVGPVFPTRRAVLARQDKPYIHAACGAGFPHPQDAKSHATGIAHTKVCPVIVAAIEKNGKRGAEAFGEWNAHESCKVGYRDINYTRVKEGYVFLDQESYGKLNRALEAGRKFKELSGEGGDADAEVEVDEEMDAEGETDDETVVPKAVLKKQVDADKQNIVEMQEDVEMQDSEVAPAPSAAEKEDSDDAAQDDGKTTAEAIVEGYMTTALSDTPHASRTKLSKKASATRRKVVKAGGDESEVDEATRAAVLGLRSRK